MYVFLKSALYRFKITVHRFGIDKQHIANLFSEEEISKDNSVKIHHLIDELHLFKNFVINRLHFSNHL